MCKIRRKTGVTGGFKTSSLNEVLLKDSAMEMVQISKCLLSKNVACN